MKRTSFAAAAASVVAALGATAAISADSSNSGLVPANGNDYVLPDGTVYQQNDDGTFSWIPTVATANAMGLDWGALIHVDALDGVVGQPVPALVTLSNNSPNRLGTGAPAPKPTPANGNDVILPNGQIYQGNPDGTWSWIPDVATANAMKLDWSSLQEVDELPGPVGSPFPHAG